MRSTALALTTLALFTLSTLPASADDWPRWRGPKGDGHGTETGLLQSWPAGGPQKLWSVSGIGTGWTSASIADGRVFVTGMKNGEGTLRCFDIKGKALWSASYGQEWDGTGRMVFPGAHSTPTIAGDHVYLITGYGVVWCFEAKTGKKAWSVDTFAVYGGRNIKWGIAESPLVDGDHVYATPGGPGASIVKLDRETGELVWKTTGLSEKSAYCSPTLIDQGGKRVLVTMLENSIVGVDDSNGKTLWKIPHRNRYAVHANTPLLASSGLLFANSGYGEGSLAIKLSDSNAKPVWEKKTFDNHFGGNVIIGDVVYGTSDRRPRGRIMSLNVTTGEATGENRVMKKGSMVACDGRLYAYGENGVVALLDPEGLRVVGQFKVTEGDGQHWAHPSISGGILYIRHGNALIAYDIKKK